MEHERLLTTRQVAERLQVLPITVQRWLRSGRLRGCQLVSKRAGWRIPESELERLLRAGRSPAGRPRRVAGRAGG
jgi:excisionase family DNA binding protein